MTLRRALGPCAAGLACIVAGACAPATSVRVTIEAEPGVRAIAERVRIVVRGSSTPGAPFGTRVLDQEVRPGVGDDPDYPFDVVLAPLSNDATRIFEITATAEHDDGTFVAQARIIGGYLPGHERTLRLVLEDSCRDVRCGEQETCTQGRCVDAREGAPGDAGIGDADAGPGDAPSIADTSPEDVRPDAGASEPIEVARVIGPGGAAGDQFGYSVAVDEAGDRLVVGAPTRDTAAGSDSGAAYVFVRTAVGDWVLESELVPDSAAAGDYFGTSVDIDSAGTRALVGAPLDDTPAGSDSGTVQVFVRAGTTWTREQTLSPPAAAGGDWFGNIVAIAGDGSRLVIGAPLDDTGLGANTGSASVFVRSGTVWTHEAVLIPPSGAPDDAFGSLAIDTMAERVAVGAWNADAPAGADAGNVTVFHRVVRAWSVEAALLPEVGNAGAHFGFTLAFDTSGAQLLVGSPDFTGVAGPNSGAVIRFTRAGAAWAEADRLEMVGGNPNDRFGYCVALSGIGERALVGAVLDDTPRGVDSGSGSIGSFTPKGEFDETLVPSAGTPGARAGFGCTLSGEGGVAVLGAPAAATSADPGSVTIWEYSD